MAIPIAALVTAVLPALIISAIRLLMAWAGQVARAAVDTADYSREILRSFDRWQKKSKRWPVLTTVIEDTTSAEQWMESPSGRAPQAIG